MKNRSYKGPIFSFPRSGRHLVIILYTYVKWNIERHLSATNCVLG